MAEPAEHSSQHVLKRHVPCGPARPTNIQRQAIHERHTGHTMKSRQNRNPQEALSAPSRTSWSGQQGVRWEAAPSSLGQQAHKRDASEAV